MCTKCRNGKILLAELFLNCLWVLGLFIEEIILPELRYGFLNRFYRVREVGFYMYSF